MAPNSYRATCDHSDCTTTGMIPGDGERVVDGTRMYRTINPEWAKAARKSNWADSKEERETAEKRAEHLSKWRHLCPECARGEGIIPDSTGGQIDA